MGLILHPEAIPSTVWIFSHSEAKEADLADFYTGHWSVVSRSMLQKHKQLWQEHSDWKGPVGGLQFKPLLKQTMVSHETRSGCSGLHPDRSWKIFIIFMGKLLYCLTFLPWKFFILCLDWTSFVSACSFHLIFLPCTAVNSLVAPSWCLWVVVNHC